MNNYLTEFSIFSFLYLYTFHGHGRHKFDVPVLLLKGYFVIKKICGISFIKIPGWSFMMGASKGEGYSWEPPRHKVTVDGFWMSIYEATRMNYNDIMGSNPSWFNKDGWSLPVESVGCYQAMEFCKRFSGKYNVKARLPFTRGLFWVHLLSYEIRALLWQQ